MEYTLEKNIKWNQIHFSKQALSKMVFKKATIAAFAIAIVFIVSYFGFKRLECPSSTYQGVSKYICLPCPDENTLLCDSMG